MKYSLILFFTCIFYSCSDTEPHDPINHTIQNFYVEDKDGNDLLDKRNTSTIDTSKIKIFYIIDNKKILALDYWRERNQMQGDNFYKGYYISRSPDNSLNFIIISLNSEAAKGEMTHTLLEWDENDTDTIKSKIIEKKTFETIARMVEYNDISIQNYNQYFTIVK